MSLIKPKVIIRCLVFVLLLGISPISLARDSIFFTCGTEKFEPQHEDLLNLFRDAFDALGMDFSFRPASLHRAVDLAAHGRTDGDCARIHDYIEIINTPSLVRIETSIASLDIQVWSRLPDISVTSMGELSKVGSRVGYRRGFKWIEVYLGQQQEIEKIAVNTTGSGLKMLAAERFDLYVGSGMQIANNLNRLMIRQPIYLTGTLATVKFYPFLHRRHQHLAAPLAVELKRLLDARGGPIK